MDDFVVVEGGICLEVFEAFHALECLFAAVNVPDMVVEDAFHAELFVAKAARVIFDLRVMLIDVIRETGACIKVFLADGAIKLILFPGLLCGGGFGGHRSCCCCCHNDVLRWHR